jgi:hypothetical protein
MKQLGYGLCLALALCACEEDDGDDGVRRAGENCEQLTGCGGDVEGTWNVEDICVENAVALAGMAVDDPACSTLFAGVNVGASGSFMFNAGALTSTFMMTVDIHAVWTPACLMALSGATNLDIAATCASLNNEYGSNGQFSAASCAVVGGNCDCELSSERELFAGNNYTVQGNKIVYPSEGAIDYCVEGNALTLGTVMDGRVMTISLSR